MNDTLPSQALKGRARGIAVGSLFALGWAVFGASGFVPALHYAILAAAIALTALLLWASMTMQRRARSLPSASAAQVAGGRRAALLFWLNFAGEIILLNIAVNLLAAPELRIYWIPAISTVVGLHFWPMAVFFRARSYWWVGGAMMAGAAITAWLIARDFASAAMLPYGEGLANAIILWSALGASAVANIRRVAAATKDSSSRT